MAIKLKHALIGALSIAGAALLTAPASAVPITPLTPSVGAGLGTFGSAVQDVRWHRVVRHHRVWHRRRHRVWHRHHR